MLYQLREASAAAPSRVRHDISEVAVTPADAYDPGTRSAAAACSPIAQAHGHYWHQLGDGRPEAKVLQKASQWKHTPPRTQLRMERLARASC